MTEQVARGEERADDDAGDAAATGTIYPADAEGRRIGVSTASAREQRYEDLLRSAPPAAPPPQARPSLFARVVAPIANALGLGERRPQPTNVRNTPEVPSRVASDSSASPKSAPQTDRTATAADDDPDTDVSPPQLLTADFTPPQVHDGESTLFAATVSDNRSGVRSVSGVIVSPSGAIQGFACTRDAETNRFTAKINVPKEAAEGVWLVKYLTLADNASNSVNLTAAQGGVPPTASFRVSSASSDATGPQLKAVWLDRQAMRAGDRNTVFVQAEDDKAGVSLVSGVFVSPSKSARLGFACRSGSDGTWECPLTPPACLDCGVWHLEQIQLQDKANNLTTFRAESQIVSSVVVDISGDRCDAAAPVITSLTLDPLVVSNAQASVIRIQATVMDEGGCGVASLSGQAMPPGGIGGQRRFFAFQPSSDGQTFTARLEIPQYAAKGEWTISWIQALDRGHNLRAYSSTDAVIARATFRVE